MQISFDHNIEQVRRGLSDVARKQLPFATAKALNETAKDIKKNAEKGLRKNLKFPTPFTMRAYTIWWASKRKQRAAVFAKDKQAIYLKRQEEGGVRYPASKAIVVPVGQKVNRYGNMPRNALKRALASPHVFSGKPNGGRTGGIYRRLGASAKNPAGKKLQLLMHYTPKADYSKRLRFRVGAEKTAAARFPKHFVEQLANAIKTAR